MVPKSLSIMDTPIVDFKFGGMILPIVISLYEGVWRASPMRISFIEFGIRGFGNRGGVKVGSMALVGAKARRKVMREGNLSLSSKIKSINILRSYRLNKWRF